MLDYVLNWRLDAIFMILPAFAAMAAVHVFLRRRHAGEGVPLRHWAILAVLVAVGLGAAEAAGRYEEWRLQRMLQGIAPTYAQEMERMGHAEVSLQTPPDDPVYLRMIDAERRWEKAHPQASPSGAGGSEAAGAGSGRPAAVCCRFCRYAHAAGMERH